MPRFGLVVGIIFFYFGSEGWGRANEGRIPFQHIKKKIKQAEPRNNNVLNKRKSSMVVSVVESES